MKSPKNVAPKKRGPKPKPTVDIDKIFERMNALQNITYACMEFGLESQQLYLILAKQGKKLDRVYSFAPLEEHEQKSFDKDRKYYLNRDINEILTVLNQTRNMEQACSVLGISSLGITGLLRRNGVKITREYVARPFTEEEAAAEAKKQQRREEAAAKKKEELRAKRIAKAKLSS